MQVYNAILHLIDKTPNEKTAAATLADNELPQDTTLGSVAEQIRSLYRGNAVYGVFQEDVTAYPFQSLLESCTSKNWEDFVSFSKDATNLLLARMEEKVASGGGYVLFLRYEENGQNFLFVLMLNDEVGASVASDLSLKPTTHLDLNKLYVAARINVTLWKKVKAEELSPDHKYVSFIRGRRAVADYFVNFLGAEEIAKARDETNQVVTAIHDYIRAVQPSDEQKNNVLKQAASYMTDCAANGQEASLSTLSARIDEECPEAFVNHIEDTGHQIPGYFQVHKATLARLKGVSFSGEGLSIRMSRKYVNGHVQISDQSVVINAPPEELVKEIEALK